MSQIEYIFTRHHVTIILTFSRAPCATAVLSITLCGSNRQLSSKCSSAYIICHNEFNHSAIKNFDPNIFFFSFSSKCGQKVNILYKSIQSCKGGIVPHYFFCKNNLYLSFVTKHKQPEHRFQFHIHNLYCYYKVFKKHMKLYYDDKRYVSLFLYLLYVFTDQLHMIMIKREYEKKEEERHTLHSWEPVPP